VILEMRLSKLSYESDDRTTSYQPDDINSPSIADSARRGHQHYMLVGKNQKCKLMIESIELQVNGEAQTCSPQTTLPQLLVAMGLNPRLLAVEYNGEILHRQFWDRTEIKTNDRLEIVTIVGGG
jgi:sulfur carrier protein